MTDWADHYCTKREFCGNYVPNTGCDSHQGDYFKCDYFERVLLKRESDISFGPSSSIRTAIMEGINTYCQNTLQSPSVIYLGKETYLELLKELELSEDSTLSNLFGYPVEVK